MTITFTQAITAASASNVRVYGSQLRGRWAGSLSGGGTPSLSFTPTVAFTPGERVSVSLPATLLNASGGSTTSHVYQFTVATGGTGRGTFLDTTEVAYTSTRDQLLADIDNDGDLDLLTTNGFFGVRSYLNQGSGQFVPHYNVGTGGQNPSGIAVADFNQDGFLDLLAGDASNPGVAIALNNGAGEFGLATFPTQVLALGRPATSFATGDVDGDGDLDFIAGNPTAGTVSVGINNGAGSFGSPTFVGVGTQPWAVQLADIDGDGDLDLLAANRGGSTVTIGFNNGTGTFGSLSYLPVGTAPIELVNGDIDADGDLDLVTANVGTGTLTILRNNAAAGFSIVAAPALPTGSTPTGLRLGDVDGDGDLDLVVAQGTGGNVFTCLNNGQGSFARQSSPLALAASGSASVSTSGVALGDVDNDGDLDLVTANGSTGRVVLGRNTPLPVLSGFSPASGVPGDVITVLGTGLASTSRLTFAGSTGNVVTSGFVANAAGTQLTGVVVPAGAITGPVSATTRGGTGTSTVSFTVPSPLLTVFQNGTLYPAGGAAYAFGQQVLGTTPVPVNFTLTNAGAQPLVISSITATGSFAIVGALPTTIAAGGSGTVAVAFAPGALGSHTGTLVVASNSGGYPSYVVPLQGSSVGPPPTLASISPASAPVGDVVTLTGTNLTGATTITFAGTAGNSVTSGFAVNGAGTQLTGVAVPSGATTGLVTVTTPGGTSAGVSFTVLPPQPPTLTSMSPSSAAGGSVVTLTGTNLLNVTSLLFNGNSLSYQILNQATIQFTMPLSAVSGLAFVYSAAGASNGLPLSVRPRITVVQPKAGPVGQSVMVYGNGVVWATSAQLNGVPVPISTATGSLFFTVPTGATSGLLTVTTPDGTSNGFPFDVTLPVTLTSVSPKTGAVGSTITLNGTNLQGTTAIAFAGTGNNTVTSGFTVNAAGTQITGVRVPSGAATGAVFVTTPNGISSTYRVTFTVNNSTNSTAPAWQGLTLTPGGHNTILTSATDAAGNVYIAGRLNGQAQFGATTLTSFGRNITYLAKWSPVTNTFDWAKLVAYTDYPIRAMAVSGSNIYVVGAFNENVGGYWVGVAIHKYTTAGNLVWKQGHSTGDVVANAVAVQGTSVYIAGSYSTAHGAAAPTFGTTTLAGTGGTDAFVAKLTDAGNSASFIWALAAGGSGEDQVRAITLNGSNVYVGGQIGSSPTQLGSLTLNATLTPGGDASYDGFVAKVTDAGSSAGFTWGKLVGGTGTDNVSALVAQGNDVFVTGQYEKAASLAPLSLSSPTAYGNSHSFVAKLHDAGAAAGFTWAQPLYSQDERANTEANALAISASGVYVGGNYGDGAQLGSSTLYSTSAGFDCFVARYQDAGSTSTLDWVQVGGGGTYAGPDQILTLSIAGNTLYAGGYVYRTANFPPFASPTAYGNDAMSFLTSLPLTATPLATQAGAIRQEISVYPNPTHGELTLQLPAQLAPTTAKLMLLDAVGRTLSTHTVAVSAAGLAQPLNFTSLPAGVYLLRITCGEVTVVRRVIID